jgi:hypothetical protein
LSRSCIACILLSRRVSSSFQGLPEDYRSHTTGGEDTIQTIRQQFDLTSATKLYLAISLRFRFDPIETDRHHRQRQSRLPLSLWTGPLHTSRSSLHDLAPRRFIRKVVVIAWPHELSAYLTSIELAGSTHPLTILIFYTHIDKKRLAHVNKHVACT